MKRFWTVAICVMFIAGAQAEEAVLTDGEVWNEGVDYYRAGDVTNALRVLRPLVLSKTHGPRAAEVVAKLEFEQGNLEAAASAAQLALRASPEDAKANRNFTRATDALPAWREQRHLEEVLKAAEGKDPGALLLQATREARVLFPLSGALATNAAEIAVARADEFSARAEKLADVWLPVQQVIAQSVTNEEQAATILQQVSAARAKTLRAAEELADLNSDAYATLSEVEHDFTRFLKLTIPPPAAIDEGIVAQTNAWLDVENFNGRSWQADALDYTRAFRAKFPAWARAYEQSAQADTNRPPFTAETQAKISALATEVEKRQLECQEKVLPPKQEEALRLLTEIRELLPKDPSSSPSPKQQPSEQPQSKPQADDQQQPPPEAQPQEQPDDRQQDQQPDEEQKAEPQEEQPDEEVEDVLKKAQERSDEHEADKKARMRKAPLPPNERDW